jgi:hypothetical protein
LNPIWCGGSRFTATNIFYATEKHRSLPHFTSSVTPGSDRQNVRSISIVMDPHVRRSAAASAEPTPVHASDPAFPHYRATNTTSTQ